MADLPRRYSLADSSPEARAERNVPHNPRPLCRDFEPQPGGASFWFWCRHCHWNQPMHDSEEERRAIAAELTRLGLPNGDPEWNGLASPVLLDEEQGA